MRKYRPDFLVRLKNADMVVLETKGQDTVQDQAKRAALDDMDTGGQRPRWLRSLEASCGKNAGGDSGCSYKAVTVATPRAFGGGAKMNLAVRGVEGRIERGHTLLSDRFPDLKADFMLANPPFKMKEWRHNGLLIKESQVSLWST